MQNKLFWFSVVKQVCKIELAFFHCSKENASGSLEILLDLHQAKFVQLIWERAYWEFSCTSSPDYGQKKLCKDKAGLLRIVYCSGV